MLDIRHLRHLVAIAEEGTLNRASERLNVTQPALTKSMHALESYLDAKLFERAGRRLKLTDLGTRLVENGRRILRAAQDTEKMVQNWNAGSSGQITVGLGPAYTVLLSAFLIETVVRDFDAVQLQLETGDTEGLMGRLLDDTVDIAICDVMQPPADTDIVAVDLAPQPIVALVRSGHALTAENAPSLKNLAPFPVGHSPAPAQFAAVGLGLAAAENQSLCLSENYDALARVSASTELVTLLPRNLAESYAEDAELQIVKLTDIPQVSMPKILYREGTRTLSPVGHQLIDRICHHLAPE